jgi:hypothetical protein
MSRLKKIAKDVETRTYDISAYPEILDQLEEILRAMEFLGSVGASRTLEIGVDGDGRARVKVKRTDKDIDIKETEIDLDNEKIKSLGLC